MFASVVFERGENVSKNSQVCDLGRPSVPGYWVEYFTKPGNGRNSFVGPFISENDALASALGNAEFGKIVCNRFTVSLQSVFDRETESFTLTIADGSPSDWTWFKSFQTIERRDEWLRKSGFVVSDTEHGLPIEWRLDADAK